MPIEESGKEITGQFNLCPQEFESEVSKVEWAGGQLEQAQWQVKGRGQKLEHLHVQSFPWAKWPPQNATGLKSPPKAPA